LIYRVIALRRSEDDVRHFTRWIAKRSLQGAESWLNAYGLHFGQVASAAGTGATVPEPAAVLLVASAALALLALVRGFAVHNSHLPATRPSIQRRVIAAPVG
jgi:hypothetical protein